MILLLKVYLLQMINLILLILFSNITLNSGNQGSESELLNNESDFEIEEILENNETQSNSE